MVRHKKILQSSYQHVYRKKIAIYVLRVTYCHWQVTLHSRLQQNIRYTFYNSTDVRIPSRVPTLCMSGRGNSLNNIRTCRSFYVIKNFMFCSYYNYSSTCIIYEVFTRYRLVKQVMFYRRLAEINRRDHCVGMRKLVLKSCSLLQLRILRVWSQAINQIRQNLCFCFYTLLSCSFHAKIFYNIWRHKWYHETLRL